MEKLAHTATIVVPLVIIAVAAIILGEPILSNAMHIAQTLAADIRH